MEIVVGETEPEKVLAHPLVSGLLESMSDGVLAIDARDRRILAMNARARTLLGYRQADVLGCQCRKMMNSPACTQACPLTAALEGREAESQLQLYYRGKDQQVMLHAETRMLLVRSSAGEPLLGIELFRDLSEVEELKRALRERRSLAGIIGKAANMQELYELVEQVAPFPIPVLLSGETGVGKERFADAIHAASPRADKPLLKINCAVLTRELAESELFGHRRGAFTGAHEDRVGHFESANGGTLLLDEVGELAPALQAKLLRVLQEGELQRIGESRVRKIDVRIIAATNRELEQEVQRGTFRADLFYRLSAVRLVVPPLRERLEDLPMLADHFLDRFAREFKCLRPQLAAEALRELLSRHWPGNVRELENSLRLAMIRAMRTGTIQRHHLDARPERADSPREETLNLAELERRAIDQALAQAAGNASEAARLLGIDRTTLWRRLKTAAKP